MHVGLGLLRAQGAAEARDQGDQGIPMLTAQGLSLGWAQGPPPGHARRRGRAFGISVLRFFQRLLGVKSH